MFARIKHLQNFRKCLRKIRKDLATSIKLYIHRYIFVWHRDPYLIAKCQMFADLACISTCGEYINATCVYASKHTSTYWPFMHRYSGYAAISIQLCGYCACVWGGTDSWAMYIFLVWIFWGWSLVTSFVLFVKFKGAHACIFPVLVNLRSYCNSAFFRSWLLHRTSH